MVVSKSVARASEESVRSDFCLERASRHFNLFCEQFPTNPSDWNTIAISLVAAELLPIPRRLTSRTSPEGKTFLLWHLSTLAPLHIYPPASGLEISGPAGGSVLSTAMNRLLDANFNHVRRTWPGESGCPLCGVERGVRVQSSKVEEVR